MQAIACCLGLLFAVSATSGLAAKDPEAAPLPDSVDLRPLFNEWGLTPRLQGNRGTCSVFTVTGALEFALAKQEGKGARLSVEFLNWASNDVIDRHADGGFFSDLWKGFEAHGICLENDMPYRSSFSRRVKPSAEAQEKARARKESGLRLHWIKEWDPKRGLTGRELEEVRETLARGWPVCGGFLWPRKQVWENGILRFCPREGVRDGHSVLLVGYRDDPELPGGGVVIVRNSRRGGRDGLLTYEYLSAYMNDAAWIDGQAGETSAAPAASKPAPDRDAGARRPANSSAGLRDPVEKDIEGWTVHVDPRLLEGPDADLGERALRSLGCQLFRITLLADDERLAKLRQLEIWIELENPRLKPMQYHPSANWLRDNDHDERLAKKVHIPNAASLLSKHEAAKHPWTVLHELAHAYEDRFLGWENERLKDAYEKAVKEGKYESVLHIFGGRSRHYGLSNHHEYFAEGTEAYFYRNDFYPFVRSELKEHDPALFEFLREVWGPIP